MTTDVRGDDHVIVQTPSRHAAMVLTACTCGWEICHPTTPGHGASVAAAHLDNLS